MRKFWDTPDAQKVKPKSGGGLYLSWPNNTNWQGWERRFRILHPSESPWPYAQHTVDIGGRTEFVFCLASPTTLTGEISQDGLAKCRAISVPGIVDSLHDAPNQKWAAHYRVVAWVYHNDGHDDQGVKIIDRKEYVWDGLFSAMATRAADGLTQNLGVYDWVVRTIPSPKKGLYPYQYMMEPDSSLPWLRELKILLPDVEVPADKKAAHRLFLQTLLQGEDRVKDINQAKEYFSPVMTEAQIVEKLVGEKAEKGSPQEQVEDAVLAGLSAALEDSGVEVAPVAEPPASISNPFIEDEDEDGTEEVDPFDGLTDLVGG